MGWRPIELNDSNDVQNVWRAVNVLFRLCGNANECVALPQRNCVYCRSMCAPNQKCMNWISRTEFARCSVDGASSFVSDFNWQIDSIDCTLFLISVYITITVIIVVPLSKYKTDWRLVSVAVHNRHRTHTRKHRHMNHHILCIQAADSFRGYSIDLICGNVCDFMKEKAEQIWNGGTGHFPFCSTKLCLCSAKSLNFCMHSVVKRWGIRCEKFGSFKGHTNEAN